MDGFCLHKRFYTTVVETLHNGCVKNVTPTICCITTIVLNVSHLSQNMGKLLPQALFTELYRLLRNLCLVLKKYIFVFFFPLRENQFGSKTWYFQPLQQVPHIHFLCIYLTSIQDCAFLPCYQCLQMTTVNLG